MSSGGKILVVDDDLELLAVLKKRLKKSGFRASYASSGREAQQLFAGSGIAFDLLLLDVFLPDINGIDLLGTLRRHQPDLPVIFMSAYLCPALAEGQGGIYRGRNFIQKPFSGKSLTGLLKKVVRNLQ